MSYFIKVWRQLRNYIQGVAEKKVITSEDRVNKIAFSQEKVNQIEKNLHKPSPKKHEGSLIKAKNFPQSNQNVSNNETFLLPDNLKNSLHEWGQNYSNISFNQEEPSMYQQIYDLLGNDTLKVEIVSKLIHELTNDNKLLSIQLFESLKDFYQRWCRGEFIDAPPENNLPQQKMLQLRELYNTSIGLRQIDVHTGLNVMILLLELHRIAQKHRELKEKIKFSPSGEPDSNQDNFFTSQLLRVINYSDAIAIGNFSNLVGEFLYGNDFSRAYLGDANLIGVNFTGANLSNSYLGDANLTGANLSNADLSFANLGDGNLSGANLSGANLENTDLSGADLSGADLSGANLSNADLSTADLNSAKLDGANLNHTNLTGAILRDAQLNNTDLSHAILFGANLSDTLLEQANLQYADLCRTDLSGANLTYANIKGANISDSILFCTNLKNAILLSTDLSYAKLNGAQLIGSNLQNAILIGADLSGVDSTGAVLNQADLSGVLLSEATLTQADLSNAILLGTDLTSTKLNKAKLNGSNLSCAILNSADLTKANLTYSILTGADLTHANLEEIVWNEQQEWQKVKGLEKAINVPVALQRKIKNIPEPYSKSGE
ncbi:MAG: pentapeptide repeat-containing protein [Cyanobacteria bacterium P01_A01_bin.84]